jgi:hypothetical protein
MTELPGKIIEDIGITTDNVLLLFNDRDADIARNWRKAMKSVRPRKAPIRP